jgi:hypothetical protein
VADVAVTAVGFVPAAPLLVPAVAGGSAHLDAEMRSAALDVARTLCGAAAGEVVVVAPWSMPGEWHDGYTWDFAGFGVARSPVDDRPRLPWPLGIGAWLLDEVGWAGGRRYVGVDRATTADEVAGSVAVLAVGDGSARRSEKAPGHLDVRAEPFDAETARLIATGDVVGLATLDAELADELMCSGAPVWRWLGGLLGSRPVAHAALAMQTAPYGVGYFVGTWRF